MNDMAVANSDHTRRARPWLPVAVLLTAIMAATSCTSGKDAAGMQPTETREEAAERVEAHLKQAIAQLPAKARAEEPLRVDNLPCDYPDDGGPAGRIIVEHRYQIRGLPAEDYPQQFETLQRCWKDRGYRSRGFDKDGAMWMMEYTDLKGYRIILGTSANGGALWIRSSSPCVWPHGTPEPED